MSVFRSRSNPVQGPPRINPLTGREQGSPGSDPVDEEARAAGQLAMLTFELPEVRRARIEKEAAEFEAERRAREERDWYARWHSARLSGAITRD